MVKVSSEICKKPSVSHKFLQNHKKAQKRLVRPSLTIKVNIINIIIQKSYLKFLKTCIIPLV